MENRFYVVEAEFSGFEISVGYVRLDWRYFTANSEYKYCDGYSFRVSKEQSVRPIVYIMLTTALCCEISGDGLDILYSSGVPVAFKVVTEDE